MANDTVITVTGNLTADPELRFTPAGNAVASFSVASTPRYLDKQTNEWVDQEALFLRCTVWRDQAEHVAESLQRGARVVVIGRLIQRSFDTKEGEKRTVIELQADEVSASLKFATAKVNRISRGVGNARPASADDPWSSPPGDTSGAPVAASQASADTASAGVGNGQAGWGQPTFDDEPPF